MENKKNSKKTVKLLVVLIALLLIACSLLGFTLARYITQGNEGTGGADIAQWNIYDDDDEDAPSGEGSVRAMLSPKKDAHSEDNTPRTHQVTSDGSAGFRITNDSDVDATVTLTITNGLTFYSNTANGDGTYPVVTNTPTENEWADVDLADIIHPKLGEGSDLADYSGFTVNVYKKDGTKDETSYTDDQDQVDTTVTYEITLDANGGYLEVLIGEITWTTDLTDDKQVTSDGYTTEDNVWEGDVRDTWIGENVGSVGFAYSWIAEQASQVPDGGVSEPTP